MPCVTEGPPASIVLGPISKTSCVQSLKGTYYSSAEEAKAAFARLLESPPPDAPPRQVRLPERITPQTDPCRLAERWQIAIPLAQRLVALSQRLEFGLFIISGYRSPDKQLQLARAGRPAAAVNVSTHTWCPATGADLSTAVTATPAVRARLGAEARIVGLRWGGGSSIDPETGIPSDWNHVDLGRRT